MVIARTRFIDKNEELDTINENVAGIEVSSVIITIIVIVVKLI